MIYIAILGIIAAVFYFKFIHKSKEQSSTKNILRKQYADAKLKLHSKNRELSQFNLLYDHCKKEFLEFDIRHSNHKIKIHSKFVKDPEQSLIAEITLHKDKPKYRAKHDDVILLRYPTVPARAQLRADLLNLKVIK